MPSSRIITLTTDFGTNDTYVAQMKGVILSLYRNVHLVDVTHEVPAHDIAAGSRCLLEAIPQFPEETIHVGVVDPGVGTTRRRIVVQALVSDPFTAKDKQCYLIGPDNGLIPGALRNDLNRIAAVWEIHAEQLLPRQIPATTFDGRNVFAPVAAILAAGRSVADLGREISPSSLTILKETTPTAQVVQIDRFGNILTNVPFITHQSGEITVTLQGKELTLPVVDSYSALKPQQPGAIRNSQGFLEIAMKETSANAVLNTRVGEKIEVRQ